MDGWLKGLVTVTCVVVIAGGGHYAWSEYQASQRREVVQKAAETAANGRFCRNMVSDLSRNESTNYKGGHIAFCINKGYVTELDFQAANAIGYVDSVRNLIEPKK